MRIEFVLQFDAAAWKTHLLQCTYIQLTDLVFCFYRSYFHLLNAAHQ